MREIPAKKEECISRRFLGQNLVIYLDWPPKATCRNVTHLYHTAHLGVTTTPNNSNNLTDQATTLCIHVFPQYVNWYWGSLDPIFDGKDNHSRFVRMMTAPFGVEGLSHRWIVGKGWRRLIGCLKLQVICHKPATNYRVLLRKITYEDKASYDAKPPCSVLSHLS